MVRSFVRRGTVAATALVLCAACASAETPDVGLAETEAGSTSAATGSTGETTATASAAADDDATASSDASAAGQAAAPASGGAIDSVASDIALVSADNEMNTQPDDVEWGLLNVPSAYTTSSLGEYAGSTGSKLLVIEIELMAVNGGNVFDEAFRLRAEDQWFNPINNLNETTQLGSVINDMLVFEVPQSVDSAVLEGGLPEELGVGRRASYQLTFEPGQPDTSALRTDDQVLALTGSAVQTSSSNEFNLQPDDNEWGMLTVTGVQAGLIEGDYTATLETMLVVVSFDVVVGEGGNFFDETFRLRADDAWYPAVPQINETPSTGEVFSGSVFFEVPRTATAFALEAGVPESVAGYEWDFSTRTATFDVTLS